MKELTIEEKAKRYDKAIERAKSWYVDAQIDFKKSLETLFPELIESEDEKIRKAIYIYLDWLEGRKDYAPKGKYSIRDMLAWLEKQGEQKPADKVEPKFKVGDIIIKSQNSDINKFGKFKITGIKDGRYWYNEFIICEISEQDEWELVEPKDYNTFDISFNAKDSELQEASYHIPKDYHAEIDGDKVVIKKGEQKPQRIISAEAKEAMYGKPVWSEKDEEILNVVIKSCEQCGNEYAYYWLKSLKERIGG